MMKWTSCTENATRNALPCASIRGPSPNDTQISGRETQVDPSMSVKRKVTVPVGRAATCGLLEAQMGPLDRMNQPAACVIRGLPPGRRPIHIRRCRLMDQHSTVVGMDVHKGRQAQTVQEGRWCLIGLGRKLDLWSR